jgi:hypothetical protein
LLLGACAAQGPSPGDVPPDIILAKATVHEFRGASTQLTAQTPSLSFFRQGDKAGQLVAKSVVLEVHTNGLHLEADEISGDAVKGLLHGRTVTAVTRSGAKVRSPAADFDRNRGTGGTATTDAGVVVVHPSFTLEAQSGSWDLDEESASLEDVQTEVGH